MNMAKQTLLSTIGIKSLGKGLITYFISTLFAVLFIYQPSYSEVLFFEDFENTNFTSRGWYDNTSLILSSTEHISGSTKSVVFHFAPGAKTPDSGWSMRKKFTDSDSVYVSYYVKYSSNWTGSNRAYHPHEFYIMTNLDNDYTGPAYSYLTAYVEQNEGEPLLALQDGRNIDEAQIGVDLTASTELRSVAGCNGDSDGYGDGSCYWAGTEYWNSKYWRGGSVYFSDSTGTKYKNDWHHIEAYIKLNSIVSNVGIADGILQYWYDDTLIIDKSDVVLRTGENPTMKFNQFLIGPWIGDGSPVDQTFWVDDLTVGTSRTTDTLAPAAPTNIQEN